MKVLSIIIPIYNVAPYLGECLSCLEKAKGDYWEAILVDDGSTDGSAQICDRSADGNAQIKVIHQPNRGVSAARNAGINAALGTWIWFVDADDIIDLSRISEALSWLSVHTGVDLAMFGLDTFDDGERPTLNLRRTPFPETLETKDTWLAKHYCFHHVLLWYRRSIINQNALAFTEGIRVAEDLEFQYKYLTICNQPAELPLTLYYYRKHPKSATQAADYTAKVVADACTVLQNLADWCRNRNLTPTAWLDGRIMRLFQNLLYSASLQPAIDTATFQHSVRIISDAYRSLNFPFAFKAKYKLATANVRLYFRLNKIYLFFLAIIRKQY